MYNFWIYNGSMALAGWEVSDSGVILKELLGFKTQSLWQNIYFHHQPNPLKSIGGENNLAGDMKSNNRKSIMWSKENYILNANYILLECMWSSITDMEE